MAATLGWVGWRWIHSDNGPPGAVAMKVQLRNSHETVYLFKLSAGATTTGANPVHTDSGKAGASPEGSTFRFRVSRLTGPPMDLTPQEFAIRLFQDQQSRGLVAKFLNITSAMGFIWVGLGLLGQVLFTGRMVVQWLASEKHKRSVVPTSFWWMSLMGATMLLIYFVWRKDVVGVLGQSVGWFIYMRNLWLIYMGSQSLSPQADPAPEAALETKGS
jgi:lipid-A-disaccharide synthase-like uncharacterized protein